MSGKKRKTFLDVEKKCEILKKIKTGVDREVIFKEYDIGRNAYYNLIKSESQIISKVSKPENKQRKVFRHLKNELLDSAVIEWFQQVRDRGDPVSGPLIREKALILNGKLNGPSDFKVSTYILF